MFWSKKSKSKKTDKQSKPAKNGSKASCGSLVGTKSQRTGAELRAEALANARAARERVGQDTIDRIAAALVQKQMSLTEQAKAQIHKQNSDRVADEIRYLLDDGKTTRH